MVEQNLGYLNYANDESRNAAVKKVRIKIPELISNKTSTLELLNNLHFESTQESFSGIHPLQFRANAAQTAMLAVGFLPSDSIQTYDPIHVLGVTSQLELAGALKIHTETRGTSRKVATINTFNHNLQRFDKERVDIYSQQDLRVDDNNLYLTPIFGVDKLMKALAKTYDQDIRNTASDGQFAEAVSRFYLIGISIIHPFIDGNARAFELFLEAEFLKRGMNLELPRDSRGKLERTKSPGQEFDQRYDTEFAKRYGIQLFPYRQTIFYPPELFSDYYSTLEVKIMDGINDLEQRGKVGEIENEFADFLLSHNA
jgi:hypothetical protein